MDVTSQVYCSLCDAHVGAGLLTGIDLNMCEKWYRACLSDLLTSESKLKAGFVAGQSMAFCEKDSMVCSPNRYVYESSEQFCEGLAFPVRSNGYTGVPTAMREGKAYYTEKMEKRKTQRKK